MSRYTKTFEIPFYDSDKYGRATPLSLLAYLGETSGEHTDKIGFGYKKLMKLNYAWMLNRWKVKINRYPRIKEEIRVETWTSSMDRFYATREFAIYDKNNKELGRASTLWIFIDMERKKPIRIPENLIKLAKPIEERLFQDFYKFEKSYDIPEQLDFHIRRSDIDYNNHVNNINYLSWMLETVPQEVYENYILKEFEILYKKEIIYGNTILAGCKETNEGEDSREFIHGIIHENKNDNHALSWSKWEYNEKS